MAGLHARQVSNHTCMDGTPEILVYNLFYKQTPQYFHKPHYFHTPFSRQDSKYTNEFNHRRYIKKQSGKAGTFIYKKISTRLSIQSKG